MMSLQSLGKYIFTTAQDLSQETEWDEELTEDGFAFNKEGANPVVREFPKTKHRILLVLPYLLPILALMYLSYHYPFAPYLWRFRSYFLLLSAVLLLVLPSLHMEDQREDRKLVLCLQLTRVFLVPSIVAYCIISTFWRPTSMFFFSSLYIILLSTISKGSRQMLSSRSPEGIRNWVLCNIAAIYKGTTQFLIAVYPNRTLKVDLVTPNRKTILVRLLIRLYTCMDLLQSRGRYE